MRVFAYCTELAREAVGRATGVEPVTSPPLTASTFDPEWLEGRDVIYFRLHGDERQATSGQWFGEGQFMRTVPALGLEQLRGVDLGGAVVIVANCYGANDDPMVQALYEAGASAVIAGPGKNLALGERVVGTDLLARWVIAGLAVGLSVKVALMGAKARLMASIWRRSDSDALEFKIIGRETIGGKDEQD